MKKILSIVLVIAILLGIASSVSAAAVDNYPVSPAYDYIEMNSVGINIDEDTGIATCTSSCYAQNGYTVEIVCSLQRYASASWLTIKTWTASSTDYASTRGTWAVYKGYTYRVYAAFRIRDAAGNLVETTVSHKTYVY